MTRETTIAWLLDSDPSIRWQVMRDLMNESERAVAAERARVATEGWGSRLLDLQEPDGHWGGGAYVCPGWTSTTDSLLVLRELGLDPVGQRSQEAIRRVRDNCTWGPEFGDSSFFDGEVEPCINGRVLSVGAYFGTGSCRLLDRLLSEQLPDGGWNCRAPQSQRSSFHTTICVLEGLLEYELAYGASSNVTEARLRAQEYFLKRHLLRRLSTGTIVDSDWTQISFPTRWHYDVLWGLDYLRKAETVPDQRVAEAIELLMQKRDQDERWPLDNHHAGEVHFHMEPVVGQPSRWNTLRSLRVLDWYSKHQSSSKR